MAEEKYIEQMWAHYFDLVVPKDAPQVQIDEAKQAFYAGVCSFYTFMIETMNSDGEPTYKDFLKMSCIAKELSAWGKSFDETLGVKRS